MLRSVLWENVPGAPPSPRSLPRTLAGMPEKVDYNASERSGPEAA